MEDRLVLKPSKLPQTVKFGRYAESLTNLRARTILLGIIFAALRIPVSLDAYAASTQPVSPPRSYCKASTLTGVQFMHAIQALITHGDLTDVAFTERTFGGKFSLQYYYTLNGKPYPETVEFRSDQALGSPIQLEGYAHTYNVPKTDLYNTAFIRIESYSFSNLGENFIEDCLKISGTDFSSYFGGKFEGDSHTAGAPMPEGWKQSSTAAQSPACSWIDGLSQLEGMSARNSTRISVGFGYGHDTAGCPDALVAEVIVRQYRPR